MTTRETALQQASHQEVRDDTTLLTLVRRGDEAAMASLYDRYAAIVYSVALRVLHHPASASDIVEELFMELWHDTDRPFASRNSLGAWLALAARNKSIDALRRRGSRTTIDRVSLAPPYDLSNETERTALAERMRIAVTALPPVHRKILGMAFFDGLTHSEIAEITNDTASAIKLAIYQSLASLRRESHE